MRLLVAEDQKDLNDIITKTLVRNHYTVDSCFDGEEALDYLEMAEYDAVILDIMMPKRDGLSVLKALRSGGKTVPVLLLTARDSVSDRVTGLDAGADDYLVKPFAFEELLARIRAMLRKKEGRAQNRCVIADLSIDFDTRSVMRGTVPISLSSKEFSILEYLANNQGIVLSRDRIEQHIWNYDYEGGSNVVDVYIRYLRKKIDDGFEPKLIHTVRGAGYVLKDPGKG
ncbi:MAG TPA: response regulator transcription factor [Candidatus Eisenbergiella stercorigallinarum]|uniref:Stage 0 sporulation protein A homolog n=1 Tax=Candidatus Eisenbergiella stercorigallinarum TaxID=2838557 RepID=A0A9D2R0W4_9FIRM|nr:response regulator transcription factor [Candidatus Eisenbergiella stercorigallinarum]